MTVLSYLSLNATEDIFTRARVHGWPNLLQFGEGIIQTFGNTTLEPSVTGFCT